MPKTTLIIGTGVSATTYAAVYQRAVGETITMGTGKHLWEQLDPDHIMGQPKALLVGQAFGTNPDRSLPQGKLDPQTFLKAGEFAEAVDKTKRGVVNNFLADRCWIKGVDFAPQGGYEVTLSTIAPSNLVDDTVKIEKVHFDRIVFAPGAGPNRPLTIGSAKDAPKVNIEAMKGHVMAGDEFMSPDWEPPKTFGLSKTVAIYGGSATASWVAELANLRGYEVVLWFTRPGDGDNWDAKSRFGPAFPAGGRNQMIEKLYEKQRKVLELQDLKLNDVEGNTYLRMYLKNEGNEIEAYVPDLLVYSLGYQHTEKEGVRAMLSARILEKMVAFYDYDRAISEDRCLLAVGVDDEKDPGSLVIVGSGMSSQFGFKIDDIDKVAKPFKDISKTLPPASAPTEGIAMLMASIEAFTRYIPVTITPEGRKWTINFNLCNRTQLAAWVASETDLPPFAANLAVELITRVRALKGNTFGLTNEVVDRFMRTSELYWEELKRLNPSISAGDLQKGSNPRGSYYTATGKSVDAYYSVDLPEMVADYLIEKGGASLIEKLGKKEMVTEAMKPK